MQDPEAPKPATDRDRFAWLIDPMTPEEFENDFHERQPARFAARNPSRYSELLSRSDLDTVLGTHFVNHRDIALTRNDEEIPMRSYTRRGRIQPLAVARCFDDGATIIFNQLHRRIPALARLSVEIGRRFSSRVQANAYLTPPGAQGFPAHWDTHDVFILQIEGSKLWSLHDTKIRLPLREQRFSRGTPAGDPTEEFELGPGDGAYIPRGRMHAARSTDQASLHVTLGLTAFTWAEFLVESISAAARGEESLRRNLPRNFARDDFPAAERKRLFEEKIVSVGTGFDPEAVWHRFAGEVLANDVPLFTDLLRERFRDDSLTFDSRLRRRAGLLIEAASEEASCVLRFAGRELRIPAHAAPAVRFAVTAENPFRVRELPDCLDPEGKLTLVKRLIREGILQRV